MPTASDYRARARNILGGDIFSSVWLTALVVCLFNSLCDVGVSGEGAVAAGITVILLVFKVITSGPITYGAQSYFLKLTRGQKTTLDNVLDGFRHDFVGNIALDLIRSLYVLLWSLLLIVPGIIKAYAYSMAFYIKNDHPDYDWKKCLEESERIMQGNKLRLFFLHISFLGWYFVGLLCFGVGVLFVKPYEMTAITEFYNDIKDT